MKKVLSLVLVALMICTLSSCGAEKIVWDDIILGEMLPEPPGDKGDIHSNSADDLWIDINDLSDKQFNDYVEACKEKGFTVDAESNSSSYEAYNAEGYNLRLSHYGNNADMSIQLEAPMEMEDITWPTSAAGKQLPAPKSTIGKFSHEYDDNFFVYVGDTSKADYAEYVKACSEKGFNVDYSKGDDYYYADNSEGWHISVCYEGNNIMSVDIDAPSEDDNSNDTPTSSAVSSAASSKPSTSNTNTGLDPDFKAAMDSYEEFMDDYVAFMKKYKANPNDLSLLADYSDYLSDYADFVEDFEKWDDEELNAAETAYYIDVQARVSKKLLEVAQ